MLTREQIYTMLMLRNRENNIFSPLPDELICHISNVNDNPDSEINVALRHAASSQEADLAQLVQMIKANPRLLLQAGNVVTRGGADVRRITLYQFFLGEGDPAAAKKIEFGFDYIPNGENQRIRQCEAYRPHIEALAKQLKSKTAFFDLQPLIEIIKESSSEDINAALEKDMNHQSLLRDAMCAFRNAVRPKRKTVGMHYEHYTTLMQAFNLLCTESKELSNNYTNHDKWGVVWRQIIGYLELGLPAVDRFVFARCFTDEKRTTKFKYRKGSYPDSLRQDLELSGLGFDEELYVGVPTRRGWWGPRDWEIKWLSNEIGKHISRKNLRLIKLVQPHHLQPDHLKQPTKRHKWCVMS